MSTNSTSLSALILNAQRDYSGPSFDNLTLASKVHTSIAWSKYPGPSFDKLIFCIKFFSKDLANEIRERGINYTVLYNEGLSCSGYTQPGIQVDCEEWYLDLDKELISDLRDNESLWYSIGSCILDFENAIIDEINWFLDICEISRDDLDSIIEIS
jgi:hypothetical protein